VSNSWSQNTTSDIAYRRAGGRRRHNWRKQMAVIRRQDTIMAYFRKTRSECWIDYGVKTRLAKMLGVSRQTIHRDISAMFFRWHPQSFVRVVDMRISYRTSCSPSFGDWWNMVHPRGCISTWWKNIGGDKYRQVRGVVP